MKELKRIIQSVILECEEYPPGWEGKPGASYKFRAERCEEEHEVSEEVIRRIFIEIESDHSVQNKLTVIHQLVDRYLSSGRLPN